MQTARVLSSGRHTSSPTIADTWCEVHVEKGEENPEAAETQSATAMLHKVHEDIRLLDIQIHAASRSKNNVLKSFYMIRMKRLLKLLKDIEFQDCVMII